MKKEDSSVSIIRLIKMFSKKKVRQQIIKKAQKLYDSKKA